MFLLNGENRYKLRNCTDFIIRFVNSVRNGLESLSYLKPKSKETLTLDLQQTKSLSGFARHKMSVLLEPDVRNRNALTCLK